MVEDDVMNTEDKARYPVFDIVPQIRAEYGGEVAALTEEQLDVDAQNDPYLRQKLVSKIIPALDTIVRYGVGVSSYSLLVKII
jgi:hypothetical protein